MLSFFKKPYFFLIFGIFVYFSFGLINITHFHTNDEHFWLPNYGSERVQEYWRSMLSGDWEDTRINDKPGISTAIISGFGIPFAKDAIHQQIYSEAKSATKQYNPQATQIINFSFRFPLLLFNGIFIFYFYWILKKITQDNWVSVWACLLILLSPVILGISQIVNPDTLFWTFGASSLLTFFAYLQSHHHRYIWITTILFGFTLLAKYVGIILLPFFFLMIIIHYIFRFASLSTDTLSFSTHIRKDIFAYATVILGGIVIFSLFMPAALIKPKLLYESTIGFPGMLPIFFATLFCFFIALFDATFFQSRVSNILFSFFSKRRHILEKILYTSLLIAVLFTLFNWMSRNSLVDLTGISFDEKTKSSFTTENSYLSRFVAEWVPLVFALTPLTLFLMIFAWAQALFSTKKHKTLLFTLSIFFLIFYIAVIEEGLLVTVRYSIILFPLAAILGAIALRTLFSPQTKQQILFSRFIAPTFLLFFLLFYGVLFLHDFSSTAGKIFIENLIGAYFFIFPLLFLIAFLYTIFIAKKWLLRITLPVISPLIISIALLFVSCTSLFLAYPHYFLYTNSLFPDRYLLFHSWGFGGYEAAQYLNAKPNAEELTIWSDTYGVCEFFIGKCIRKQKFDTTEYPVDYLIRTLRGTIAPKFPHDRADHSEWDYAVGGRSKNFVKIYKNNHE